MQEKFGGVNTPVGKYTPVYFAMGNDERLAPRLTGVTLFSWGGSDPALKPCRVTFMGAPTALSALGNESAEADSSQ